MRNPCTATKSSPRLPKSVHRNEDPTQPKIKYKYYFLKSNRRTFLIAEHGLSDWKGSITSIQNEWKTHNQWCSCEISEHWP